MCAGVNDIINNLHLVNTISKPTQNFSICWVTVLAMITVTSDVFASILLVMVKWFSSKYIQSIM